MTTYNAKDLIEQAQMLADLQNSDFISWKENMMFLDNAWADLYQQIINHGDKTFLKSFTMEESRVELPDDFYQLQYICYTNGLNSIPINRKSKTANNNSPYYDIVGNELIIYNRNNCYRTIKVDYFPTRESITFAADDQKIEPINDAIIDVCNRKVLTNNKVIDIINGTDETVTSGFMLSDSGVVTDNTKPYFKKNNKAYYSIHSSNVLTIYKKNGAVYKKVEAEVVPNFPVSTVNALTDYGIYWADTGTLKYWDFDTKVTTDFATGLISNKVYSFDNNIYYETTEGIWCNNELVIPSSDYDTFNGVLKVDMKTGYGILTDNYVIKSVFPTTELDYPNNFYYNFLAYKLAVYYKIKQGADSTGVLGMANNALKTFYDSVQKDENEYVRIANVYAR